MFLFWYFNDGHIYAQTNLSSDDEDGDLLEHSTTKKIYIYFFLMFFKNVIWKIRNKCFYCLKKMLHNRKKVKTFK